MPDPQTLNDVLARWRADYKEMYGDCTAAEPGRLLAALEKDYGDYHIIPGAKCVVKDLEAAAKALLAKIREQDEDANLEYHSVTGFYSWEDCTVEGREQWCEVARTALEATGITVCDEVVNARADSPLTVGFDTPERAVMITLKRGDTIWIKNKED